MTDFEQMLAFFEELESKVDVESLRFGGVHVWPLIKSRLRRHLINPQYSEHNRKLKGSGGGPEFVEYMRSKHAFAPVQPEDESRWLDELEALGAGADAEALFYVAPNGHQRLAGDRWVAPHLDSVLTTLAPHIACCKLELAGAPGEVRRLYPSTLLDPARFIRLAMAGQVELPSEVYPEEIAGIREVRDTAARIDPTMFFTTRSMVNILTESLLFRRYFEQVLRGGAANVLFQTCFYANENFALTAAAADCGIISVDIQHGQLVNDPIYSGWNKQPATGYAYLPDQFWVWSGDEAAFIEPWTRTAPVSHGVVVTGNRWPDHWRKVAQAPTPEENRLLDKLSQVDEVLLFTLSPVDGPMPNHVLTVLREDRPDRFWVVRAHPLWQDAHFAWCRNHLEGVANVEFETASRINLYHLLPAVDIHVTGLSTVSVEALLFDVPTIIASKEGATLFRPQLDQGVFRLAETGEELNRILAAGWPKKRASRREGQRRTLLECYRDILGRHTRCPNGNDSVQCVFSSC